MYPYLSETLARDQYRETLDRAREARQARRARELRKVRRRQRRAERRLMEAWQRADELREALDVAS